MKTFKEFSDEVLDAVSNGASTTDILKMFEERENAIRQEYLLQIAQQIEPENKTDEQ